MSFNETLNTSNRMAVMTEIARFLIGRGPMTMESRPKDGTGTPETRVVAYSGHVPLNTGSIRIGFIYRDKAGQLDAYNFDILEGSTVDITPKRLQVITADTVTEFRKAKQSQL